MAGLWWTGQMESPIVSHRGPGPLDAPSVVWDMTASWRGMGGGSAATLMALSVPAVPWTGLAVVSSPQMVQGFLGTELQADDVILCPGQLHLLLPAGCLETPLELRPWPLLGFPGISAGGCINWGWGIKGASHCLQPTHLGFMSGNGWL